MSQQAKPAISTTRFTKEDLDKVQSLHTKQQALRKSIKDTGKFSEQEKAALGIESIDAFGEFWAAALGSKQRFDAERDHGTGLAKKTAVNFGASAYGIMKDVNPMLEIVKDFGAPYGGLAIGTVSFFFAVLHSRASMEKQIGTTLLSIQDRLPGIKMYQHIYNDNHELDQQLQSKIVDAYDTFIEFCIAAIEFFIIGGLHRFALAVKPSNSIKQKATSVQEAFVAVRLTCEDLLSKNVDIIKNASIRQLQQISDLQKQVKELQESQDTNDLERIRLLLNVRAHSQEAQIAQLEQHSYNVNMEFRLGMPGETVLKNKLSDVRHDGCFQSWLQSPDSRLLILVGHNQKMASRHCWLSPIAMDFIKKQAALADPFVFHIFGMEDDNTIQRALSVLTFRLLSLNRNALRYKAQYAELWAELQNYQAARADPEGQKVSNLLQKVAIRVLNSFDTAKTIWIVLDRADQCQAEAVGSQSRYQRRALIKAMAQLVKTAHVKVRILAVVNRWSWDIKEDEEDFDEDNTGKVAVHTFYQDSTRKLLLSH